MPSTPTSPTHGQTSIATRTRASLFKVIYDSLPRIRSQRRDTSEGLIAPRSPAIIPASPSHSSQPLHRVPSFTNMPPPMLSPSRRLSSDSYAAGSGPAAPPLGPRRDDGTESLSFRLGAPPRRTASGTGSLIRDPSEGAQFEIRRTTSTFARMQSADPDLS